MKSFSLAKAQGLAFLVAASSCSLSSPYTTPAAPETAALGVELTARADQEAVFGKWNKNADVAVVFSTQDDSREQSVFCPLVIYDDGLSAILYGVKSDSSSQGRVTAVRPASLCTSAREMERCHTLYLGLPSEQAAKADTSLYDISVFSGEYEETYPPLKFRNVCALVSISARPRGDQISKIVLKAQGIPLAGDVPIDLKADIPDTLQVPENPCDSIVLSGSFESGKTYYATVLPCRIDSAEIRFTSMLGKEQAVTEPIKTELSSTDIIELGPYVIDFDYNPEHLNVGINWLEMWQKEDSANWSGDFFVGASWSDGSGISYDNTEGYSAQPSGGYTCQIRSLGSDKATRVFSAGGTWKLIAGFSGEAKITIHGYGTGVTTATSIYYKINDGEWTRPWGADESAKFRFLGYQSNSSPIVTEKNTIIHVDKGDVISLSGASATNTMWESLSLEKYEQ